uniref:Uncharacterized protein LOC100180752 n=1 Tax=Phallusia mammillata TaxID=59560 RepID=A0A6F9DI19_9ASCI|nr:uncharacterized protein LOC100180752 [Phallusia mammillata]
MEIVATACGIRQTLGFNPECMENNRSSRTGSFKQRVTVRDGEINDVFESCDRLKSLSCLDRLRNFSSSNLDENQREDVGVCCDVTNGDSDGGFVSHDEADIASISSFASASSFSSEILNGWLNEEEFDSRQDSLLENEKMEQTGELDNTKNVTAEVSNVTENSVKSACVKESEVKMHTQHKSDVQRKVTESKLSPLVTRGTGLKTQRDVFWSTEPELRSTVDFRKVLPDLLKFNIFSAEQKSRYGDFKGKFSSLILQAVGERIDQDESVLGPFLLALRPHYPAVVDKIHQRVFCEVHSQRPKPGSLQNENCDTGGEGFQKTRGFPKHQRRYNFDHQGSPYARRQFTVNSSRDPDHMINLHKNYLPHPATSRYFSKDTLKHSAIPNNNTTAPQIKPSLTTLTTPNQHTRLGLKANNTKKLSSTNDARAHSSPKKNAKNKKELPSMKTNDKLVESKKTLNHKTVADHSLQPVIVEPEQFNQPADQADKTVDTKDGETKLPEEDLSKTDQPEANEDQQPSCLDETPTKTLPEVVDTSVKNDQEEKGTTDKSTEPIKRSSHVKRATSFQEHRTGQSATGVDKITPENKIKRSRLLKNYFHEKQDGKPRTRSLSFSSHPEKSQKTKNSPTADEIIQSKLEQLSMGTEASQTDKDDPDAVLTELVKRCVVSARSGWLIRRFPSVSDRRNKLLTLLANLPECDVAEVKENCPITIEFVKRNCRVEKTTKTEKEEESPPKENNDVIMTSATAKPNLESTSPMQNQCEIQGTESKNMLEVEAEVEATTTTTTDLCGAKQLRGANSDLNRDIDCDITLEEARQAEENERERIRVGEIEAFSLGVSPEEKVGPPTESFSNLNCTQQNNITAIDQQSLTEAVQDSTENFPKQQAKELSTGDNLKEIKAANSGEKLKKKSGTFVSHVLFPISKRKNAEIRKKSEVGKLAVPVKVTQSAITEKQKDCPGNFFSEINSEMPPVLSVVPSQKIDLIHGHCMEPIHFDRRSPSPLTTILTNGGNISPPSSKKKGARVSFSQLPPVEIELEPQNSDWDSKSNSHSTNVTSLVTDSVVTLTVKSEPVVQEQTPTKPVIVTKKTKKKPVNHSINEIDQINELLMDILEEIEADNISLNHCLDNLVRDGLMSEDVALSVSPNFVEFQTRSASPTLVDEYQSDVEKERGVEKLLDVLTNLGLEKLQRCRNCVLGRLCQLARYEDFESAQKAAAAASDSSPELSASRKTYEKPEIVNFPVVNSPPRALTTGRVPSTEDSELSATESDDDFYSLRHQIGRQRHDVITNPTIEEEDDDNDFSVETNKRLDQNHNVLGPREIVDVKAAMPTLIDNCVIAPRHAWLILGAGDEHDQKAKLKQFLRLADQAKLQSLYSNPQFSWIKTLMEDDNIVEAVSNPRLSFLKARERFQKPASKLGRSSSLRASDLHGGNAPNFSDVADLVEKHAAAREEQEKRLSPPLDALLKGRGASLRRTQSVNMNTGANLRENRNTDNETDENLSSWCRSKQLSQQITDALSQNGYQGVGDLRGITESEIEQLSGLGWIEKAKLWVAVENLRLDEFYQKTHSGLADIMKILDK